MPGDILETNTVDAFGNAIQSPATSEFGEGRNPLTGPFYIEGAEPGDTLVVEFLDVQVDSKQAWVRLPGLWRAKHDLLHTMLIRRCPKGSGSIQ